MVELSQRPHGDVLEISIKGEIDVMAAADIKVFFQEAKAQKCRHYLINFEKVEKINYSVVQNINGPIVDLMTIAQVSVCSVPAPIEKVLKNTVFFLKAKNFADKKEALAAILSS